MKDLENRTWLKEAGVEREALFPSFQTPYCSALPQRKVRKCVSHLHSTDGYSLLLPMVPSIRRHTTQPSWLLYPQALLSP